MAEQPSSTNLFYAVVAGLVVGAFIGLLINALGTMLLISIVGGVIASYLVDFEALVSRNRGGR